MLRSTTSRDGTHRLIARNHPAATDTGMRRTQPTTDIIRPALAAFMTETVRVELRTVRAGAHERPEIGSHVAIETRGIDATRTRVRASEQEANINGIHRMHQIVFRKWCTSVPVRSSKNSDHCTTGGCRIPAVDSPQPRLREDLSLCRFVGIPAEPAAVEAYSRSRRPDSKCHSSEGRLGLQRQIIRAEHRPRSQAGFADFPRCHRHIRLLESGSNTRGISKPSVKNVSDFRTLIRY